jgi:hypothetical protein
VWVEYEDPLLGLATVTRAFWMTAPPGSLTVPEIVPVSTWANATLARLRRKNAKYLYELRMAVMILVVGWHEM